MVVSTAGGALLGYVLDGWLGTSHWLTLAGLGLGIVVGFREFIRMIKAAGRNEQ